MAFRGIGLEKNGLGRGWPSAQLVFKILSFINPGLGRVVPRWRLILRKTFLGAIEPQLGWATIPWAPVVQPGEGVMHKF